jgi:hypothetical protein
MTTARWINSAPVSIIFHPKSHTAGTHAGISLDLKKSKISPIQVFSFRGNSFTVCEIIHPFYHSGLWVRIIAYTMDLYLR